MELSKKQKIFSQCFTDILKSTFNFQNFEKSDESHSLCFSGIMDSDIRAYVNV